MKRGACKLLRQLSCHQPSAATAAATAAAASGVVARPFTIISGGSTHGRAIVRGGLLPRLWGTPVATAALSTTTSSATAGDGSSSGGGGSSGGRLKTLALGAVLGSAATALASEWSSRGTTGSPSGNGDGAAGAPPDVAGRLRAARAWLSADAPARLAAAVIGANTAGKVGFIVAACMPVVFASAFLYRRAVPRDPGLLEAVMRSFALLFRAPLVNEPSLAAYAITHGTFMLGFFAFAVMLSVVGESVQRQFEYVRSGHLPVPASQHLVLLGWNDTVVPMLRQLARRRGSGGGGGSGGWDGSVAVLADKPKQEMDAAVREELHAKGYKLEVHTRRGVPFKPADLVHVGADRARHVVLLQSEGASAPAARALSAATAMSLATLRPAVGGGGGGGAGGRAGSAAAGGGGQSVVVQVGDDASGAEELLSVAAGAGLHSVLERFRALETPGALFVSRLIAQAACEPGVLRVWTELLDPSPLTPQLRTLDAAAAQGAATYGQARMRCPYIVCGVLRGTDAAVRLSPRDATALAPGDRLIALLPPGPPAAATGDTAALVRMREDAAAAAAAAAARVAAAKGRGRGRRALLASKSDAQQQQQQQQKPRHVLVIGWPTDELGTLLDGLATFSGPGGSQITVLSPEPAPAPPTRGGASNRTSRWWWGDGQQQQQWVDWQAPASGGGGGAKVRFLRVDQPLAPDALAAAGVAECDVVVLGGAPHAQGATAAAAVADGAGGALVAAAAATSAGAGGNSSGSATSKLGTAAEPPRIRDARIMQSLLSLQRGLLASGRTASVPNIVAPISALASADLARDFFATLREANSSEAAAAAAAAATAATATPNGGEAAAEEDAAAADGDDARPDAIGGTRLLGPAHLDFLKPNDVVAALLLQMSLDPSYIALIGELLYSSAGHEVYVRPPGDYGFAPGAATTTTTTFAAVAEAARLKGHTALGVVRAGGGACQLAPAPDAAVTFAPGDGVVVIAED